MIHVDKQFTDASQSLVVSFMSIVLPSIQDLLVSFSQHDLLGADLWASSLTMIQKSFEVDEDGKLETKWRAVICSH